MNSNRLFTSLAGIAAGVVLMGTAALAQVSNSVPIVITNSLNERDTLYIGVNPTATFGIDVPLGEAELPPLPPDDIFDVRFRTIAGTHNQLGQGSKKNYHPYSSSSQVDTFRIGIQAGGGGANYPVTVSWPANMSQYFGTATFRNGTSSGTNTNMLTGTSVVLTEETTVSIFTSSPMAPSAFQLIGSPLNFGTVQFPTPGEKLDSIRINNTGTSSLSVTNIASSNSNFVLVSPTSFPLSIAAGGHIYVAVRFDPASEGNYSGNLTITHSESGSPATVPMSGVASSGEGLYFLDPLKTVLDNTPTNLMYIGLKYTGTTALGGLQFKLTIPNSSIRVNDVQLGPAITTPGNWNFDYETEFAASGSELTIVLYGRDTTRNLPTGVYDSLFRVSYRVADIKSCDGALGGDMTNEIMYLGSVISALANGLGQDAGVGIDALRDTASFTIHQSSGRGDVNCDDKVNILDVLASLDVVLGRNTFAEWQRNRADLAPWSSAWSNPNTIFDDGINYGNLSVDVADLVLIVNAILLERWPDGDNLTKVALGEPSQSGSGDKSLESDHLQSSSIYDVKFTYTVDKNGIRVSMENKVPLKGVQMKMKAAGAPSDVTVKMATAVETQFVPNTHVENDEVRLVLYSPSGNSIDPMNGEFFEIPFSVIDPTKVLVIEPIIAGGADNQGLKVEYSVNRISSRVAGAVTGLDASMSTTPNPFSTKTTIAYTLRSAGTVWLTVADANGREVARVIDGMQQTVGAHTAEFDGSNLPSGTYFAKLTVDGRTTSTTVVIVR